MKIVKNARVVEVRGPEPARQFPDGRFRAARAACVWVAIEGIDTTISVDVTPEVAERLCQNAANMDTICSVTIEIPGIEHTGPKT